MNGPMRLRSTAALHVAVVLLVAAAGCQDRSRRTNSEDVPLSAQDSVATDAEVRASLAGETAPKQQSYSYRGLYAGMTREHLERVTSASPAACTPAGTSVQCSYETSIGPDSAAVHLDVTYVTETTGDQPIAREIIVTRPLPLTVDGVMLARELSDAFERQTALLDRRDASYGHHEAHVRMGTINGARQNFVEFSVTHKVGREMLALTLTRGAPAAVKHDARPPAIATPAARAPAAKAF